MIRRDARADQGAHAVRLLGLIGGIMVGMGTLVVAIAGTALLAQGNTTAGGSRAVGVGEVFRSGGELVVVLDRFDSLRHTHPGLRAEVVLRSLGPVVDANTVRIDLSDAAVKGALVFDLSQFGRCGGLTITLSNGRGERVAEKTVAPIPDVAVRSRFQTSNNGPWAFIETPEPVSATSPAPSLRIALPHDKDLRPLALGAAARSVSKREITYPVIGTGEAPLRGNVFVAPSTAAPKDPAQASLYISYKKAIYENDKLARWRKFLVEIPIQKRWGAGRGDETVGLADAVRVHVTNERKPKDWAGVERNILGEGDEDLGQTVSTTDEQGRLYFFAENRVVRFDPHTAKFEIAPPFVLQKLCPGGDTMKGSPGWLSGNLTMVCTRGRVFLLDILDYKTGPNRGSDVPQRRIGGLFSISQDWRDAQTFDSDIRLHVGSWETASPTLYNAPPEVGAAIDERKLGLPVITETGLLLVPAGRKGAGGPWRLDLDDKGRNVAFGEVATLTDTVSKDGKTKFSPTRESQVSGISRTMLHMVSGTFGRHLIGSSDSQSLDIPRASIRQLLLSDGWNASMLLPQKSKHDYRTWSGAPEGTVRVEYDVTQAMQRTPSAKGELLDSLQGGPSLGPVFLVTPVPGEADRAVAVCEYAVYPLSTFDFSHLNDRRAVLKSNLPPRTPVSAGVGVYDSAWVTQGDEQWLYLGGYVGLTRIKYSHKGQVLDSMSSQSVHTRLQARASDQHPRAGLKQYDRLLPVLGGRLLNAGAGRLGRGGTPFSTGLELFDPKALGSGSATDPVPSQTAAYLSRCCGTVSTLQSRVVWGAHDGACRQEIFGTGRPNAVFVSELDGKDRAAAPTNLDQKVFAYEVADPAGLRARYGFSLPLNEQGRTLDGYLALSDCQRYLVILRDDGALYSFDIARHEFIDGVALRGTSGDGVTTIGFRRPGENILTAPDGQLFILTRPTRESVDAVQFQRVSVSRSGQLRVEPYLRIVCDGADEWQDFSNCVRCFLPDLKRNDGSADLIWGWDSKDRAQAKPAVRVISDFVPADPTRLD